MASNWDLSWDDDDWRKRQSFTTLYHVYQTVKTEGNTDFAEKIKAELDTRLNEVQDFSQESAYDCLSYSKYMGDDAQYSDKRQDLMELAGEKAIENSTKLQDDKAYFSLLNALQAKAWFEILLTSPETVEEEIKTNAAAGKKKCDEIISKRLEDFKELYEVTEEHYIQADEAGLISPETQEKFIQKIAQLSGFDKIDGKVIEKNDSALLSNVKNLDVYDEKGKLNDLYSDCAEALNDIEFDFPDTMTSAEKDSMRQSLLQQLLSNAALRATHDVLADRSFVFKNRTPQQVVAAYKDLIAKQFERSVLLAKIASSKDFVASLDDAKIEKGNIVKSEALEKFLGDNANGEGLKINPLAVEMDSHQLDSETKRVEKVFEAKKVKKDQLKFWQKGKMLFNAAYKNMVKQGGWKKVVANAAIFGLSSAAMVSGGWAIAGAGALAYASWTAANAWAMPVHDALNKEMDALGITDKKARKAYRKENIKRIRQEKYAEAGFKRRAWARTVEGVLSGTATLLGGAVWRPFISSAGKGVTAGLTLWQKLKAKRLFKNDYSVEAYKKLSTLQAQLKSDTITLGAVVAGSAIGAGIRFANNSEEFSNAFSDIKSGLQNKVDSVTGTNEAPTVEVAPEAPTVEVAPEAPTVEVAPEAPTVEVAPEAPTVEVAPEAPTTGVTPEAPTVEVTPEAVTETAPEYSFDSSRLSHDEMRMYRNSVKKWTDESLEGYVRGLRKDGSIIAVEVESVLRGDGSGKSVVEAFYQMIESGKVETLPEGVSAAEYVDKLTRLIQLAPHAQRQAINVMIKDLLCDDFKASTAEISLVKNALDTIVYEKGSMECVIPDANGNLCVTTTPMFGQYVGSQRMAEVEMPDGTIKELPLRTSNRTIKIGAEVNCDDGSAKIVSLYKRESVDCGCEHTEENVDSTLKHLEREAVLDVEPIKAPMPEINQEAGEMISVNFAGEQEIGSKGTAVYSASKDDYGIMTQTTDENGNTVYTMPEDAKYLRMGMDGKVRVWQKGAMVSDDLTSQPTGVETSYPVALNLDLSKINISEIKDNGDSLYMRYGEGRGALSVEINKADGLAHVFIGKKEYMLDQETSQQLGSKISEDLQASQLKGQYTFSLGEETEQNNEHLGKIAEDKKFIDSKEAKESRLERRINNSQRENTVAQTGNSADSVTETTPAQEPAPAENVTEAAASTATYQDYTVSSEVAQGTYRIDNDGITVNMNMSYAAHPSYNLIDSKMVVTQGEDGLYHNAIGNPSKEYADAVTNNKHVAKFMVRNEIIYEDIAQRKAAGEVLPAGADKFMKSHEEMLNRAGLEHGKDGKLVSQSKPNGTWQQILAAKQSQGR